MTAGCAWVCKGKDGKKTHAGWDPRVPTKCPICGEPISSSNHREPTANQLAAWQGRQG